MVRKVVPWVTHERLDDEVIAINLETGAYFAFDDVAADCWTLLVGGVAPDDIATTVAARYGATLDVVQADVAAFISELEANGLLEGDHGTNGVEPIELPASVSVTSYVPPAVNKFDDLEELLLLDPVHEVDDAGWPVARE